MNRTLSLHCNLNHPSANPTVFVWGLCLKQQKIEWDLTNGPLSKLIELLDTQGIRSVGPVGDFLEAGEISSQGSTRT